MLTLSLLCLLGAHDVVLPQNDDAFFKRTDQTPLAPLPAGVRARVDRGFIARVEPRLGVPSIFWAMRVGPAAPEWANTDVAPSVAARRYLREYAPLYRFNTSDIDALEVFRVHDVGTGAVIVSFTRRLEGVPLFRDVLTVVMTRRRELVAVTGSLNPHVVKGPTGAFFSVPVVTALTVAARDALGVSLQGVHVSQEPGASGWMRLGELSAQLQVARARRVWFGLPDSLEAAWQLEISDMHGHAFLEVISARDARVLSRKNLTESASATYRVWASTTPPWAPADSPFGTETTPHPTGLRLPPLVVSEIDSSLVTLDTTMTTHPDPWLPAASTTLAGNNIVAFADVYEPNGYNPPNGVLPDGGLLRLRDGGIPPEDRTVHAVTPNTFDARYDFVAGVDGAEQASAAIAQLFFVDNWTHDWLYPFGFDEAAGNGQKDNFGRGGLGNDAMNASALDYSRPDNASMSTFGDGESPDMEMGNFVGLGAYFLSIAEFPDGGSPFAERTNFGPAAFDVTAPLVAMAVDGGFDGCDELLDRASLAGRVALAMGTRCPMRDQVLRAQDAGCVGVVVAPSGPTAMFYGNLISPQADGTEPPVMAVTGKDATSLLSTLNAGTSLTARLYVANAPPRPSALDTSVTVHEFGHFLSNRLISDASGLSLNISRSLGEGWSDFLALMQQVRASDAQVASNSGWHGAWAAGAWAAAGTDPDGNPLEEHWFGIRRVPYSTDFSKNGLSFRHIREGASLPPGALSLGVNSEVHNAGEVWATMLWECFVSLLTDRQLPFAQAQDLMMRTLVGSLKATPANPDFLEARDAVLAVAFAEDRSAFEAMYRAFARRGAGPRAVAPSKLSSTNSPLIEDTSITDFIKVTGATVDDSITWCDHDGALDVGETGLLHLTARNLGMTGMSAPFAVKVVPLTRGATIVGDSNALFAPVQPFGLVEASVKVALTQATTVQQLEFRVDVPGSTVSQPTLVTVLSNTDFVAGSTEDFEGAISLDRGAGWRRGNDLVGSGFGDDLWQTRPESALSTVLWGPNAGSQGHTWVTTPALDVGPQTLTIRFKHRWQLETLTGVPTVWWDGAYLEVSDDGQRTWVPVTSADLMPGYNGAISTLNSDGNAVLNLEAGRAAWVGSSMGYPAMRDQVINFGTRYAGKTIHLRFVMSTDANGSQAGWDIDDFQVTGITSTPFTQRVADRQRCLNREPSVIVPSPFEAPERTRVSLHATTMDPDGDTLNIEWTQLSGPAVSLMGESFVTPEVTKKTSLTFKVTVSDAVISKSAEATVVVTNVNRAPEVTATPLEGSVHAGAVITLTATATDPDADPVEVTWVQTRGPLAVEKSPGVFVAPAVKEASRLYFEVRASDGSAVTTAEVDVGLEPAGCGCHSSAGSGPLLVVLLVWGLRRRRVSGQ